MGDCVHKGDCTYAQGSMRGDYKRNQYCPCYRIHYARPSLTRCALLEPRQMERHCD